MKNLTSSMGPDQLSLATFVLLSLTTFATSAFTAISGLGGGMTLIIVLQLFLPMKTALPVHAVVQAASNISRVLAKPQFINWQVIRPYFCGVVLGLIVGGQGISEVDDRPLSVILAVFILYTTWFKLPDVISRPTKESLILLGVFSAILSFFIGISGPLLIPMLIAYGLGKDSIVVTASVMAALTHLSKCVTFFYLGFDYYQWSGILLIFIVATSLGSYLGTAMRDYVSEKVFKIILKTLLTLVALRELIGFY